MKRLPGIEITRYKIISKIANSTNTTLQRIIRTTQLPNYQLSHRQQKIVENIGKKTFNLKTTLLLRQLEKRPLSLQEVYEAVFIGAIEKLKSRKFDSAVNLLGEIGHEWLNNPLSGISPAIGKKAIELSRAISSSWAAAHASHYAGIPIRAKVFLRREIGYGGEKVSWSGDAVKNLAATGTLKDLVTIREIERNCREGAMELTCQRAMRRIITRNALQFSLMGINNLLKIGIKTRLTKQQAVQRLEVLFGKMGLSSAIQNLPGFRIFEAIAVNPVERIQQAADLQRLAEQHFNTIIELGPVGDYVFSGTEVGACEEFLLEQNMILPQNANRLLPGKIKENKPRVDTIKYVLTEKGKTIVRNLCSRMGKIRLEIR